MARLSVAAADEAILKDFENQTYLQEKDWDSPNLRSRDKIRLSSYTIREFTLNTMWTV